MGNKNKYYNFCKIETNLPIFLQYWWLDSVCEEKKWDVALVENGDKIVAVLPYYMIKHYGKTAITMPKLTQFMGPWLTYPENQKYCNRISYEKKIMIKLIEKLPEYSYFCQNFYPGVTNWLPFFWKGFLQTTRYTYAIDDLADMEKVWSDVRENIKTDIRKARKVVTVRDNLNIESFLDLNEATFKRQGMTVPYDRKMVRRLDRACVEHNCRRIFFAEDGRARIHAAIYIIWDDQTVYYLMGGADPDLRNSGAASLLIWEALSFAGKTTKSFDFEGSMMEPVERFFRSFGAIQKPYFKVTKVTSKIVKFKKCLTELFK